jgi:hypothetical protein
MERLADQLSQTIAQLANDWNDIKIIQLNASKSFQNQLDNIYKSMDVKSKGGDLDPITYIIEQNRAEILQKKLFEDIQKAENDLTKKYDNIKNKLSNSAIVSGITNRARLNQLSAMEKSIFGDNPILAAESLGRDIENIKLECDMMKATIVTKSVILPKVNQIRELKNLFKFSILKMQQVTVGKEAYVGDIIQYGYSLANLFKDISDDYFEKAQNTAYAPLSDVLQQNGIEYNLTAQQYMSEADKAALPGLIERLGRDTTPSGDIASTVALSGVINEMTRFAKDNSVESDKRFRNYWDSLMMESVDPVELGTIIEEKPKHGDKTIKEEQELHGTKQKKSKFKVNRRFKKN